MSKSTINTTRMLYYVLNKDDNTEDNYISENEDESGSVGSSSADASGSAEPLGLTILEVFKTVHGAKLVIALGSVVEFQGDAIVNAANEGCLGGSGIDGAIGEAGGGSLYAARKKLRIQLEGMVKKKKKTIRCYTGEAVTTSAPEGKTFGSLKARHVIHAVGPNYKDDAYNLNLRKADKLLISAYKNSLEEANKARATTIAFSLLSSSKFAGKRGKKDVIKMGIESINTNAKPNTTIYMVAFVDPKKKIYEELINLLKATKEAKFTFTNPRINNLLEIYESKKVQKTDSEDIEKILKGE